MRDRGRDSGARLAGRSSATPADPPAAPSGAAPAASAASSAAPAAASSDVVARPISLPRTACWVVGTAAVLVTPYIWVPLFDNGTTAAITRANEMSLVLVQVGVATAALLLLCEWWFSHRVETGVLGAVLAFMAIQDLPFALAAFDPAFSGYLHRLTWSHVVVTAVGAVVIATIGSRGFAPRRHPFAIGVLLGTVVLAARLVLTRQGWDPVIGPTDAAGLATAVAAAVMLIAACLVAVRRDAAAGWAWYSVAVVVALWYAAHVLGTLIDTTDPTVASVVPAVLLGTFVVVGAGSVLRTTIAGVRRSMIAYEQRASDAEDRLRHTRELVHEMNDTAAGIAAGAHLLAQERSPSEERRDQLAHMIDSEVSRLGRMVSASRRDTLAALTLVEIDLDDVLGTLATAQEALGRQVVWQPQRHVVLGDRDAITEVLTVLLTNAARHADGACTTVSTQAVGDWVEIRVADQGPGVPEPLIPTIFEWGTRGPRSSGSGIGLQVARRLMNQQGGSLELEAGPRGSGATFVVVLRAAPTSSRRTSAPDPGPSLGLTNAQRTREQSWQQRRGQRPAWRSSTITRSSPRR